MKPPPVRYARPATVEGAVALLGGASRPLAGGQSLMPQLNQRVVRPSRLVDLTAIPELQRLELATDGSLIVGAAVTLSRLERAPVVRRSAALLIHALRLVANPQVRARGTIGGNVAHGDAVSEIATALVALGAVVTVRGRARMRVSPVEGLRLADDELLIDVRIPVVAAGPGAIHEVAVRYAARALVVAAAVARVDDEGLLHGARIAVAGVGPSPVTLAGMSALSGVAPDSDTVDEVVGDAVGDLPIGLDPRADEGYRRDVGARLAARALHDAAQSGLPPAFDHGPGLDPGPVAVQPMHERDGPSDITMTVNGRREQVTVEPRMLLSDLVRGALGLTSTHVGCEHGVCGACNVLLDGVAVRSCLLLAIQVDGREVTTLEGLRDGHDVAELIDAFVENHALQCGFCTPGFMVTLAELRGRGQSVEPEQLIGNICRCTGYAPILRAAESVG